MKKEKNTAVEEKTKQLIDLKNNLTEANYKAESLERKLKVAEKDSSKFDTMQEEYENKIKELNSIHAQEKYSIIFNL